MPHHPWPLVKQGDVDIVGDLGHPGSNNVHTVQHLSEDHGFPLVTDGIFGPRTDARCGGFRAPRGLCQTESSAPERGPCSSWR